jgi:hypothetical protein
MLPFQCSKDTKFAKTGATDHRRELYRLNFSLEKLTALWANLWANNTSAGFEVFGIYDSEECRLLGYGAVKVL